MCDRTGSRFSGLVMRLSTNLLLEFIILHFTSISTSSSKRKKKISSLCRNLMRVSNCPTHFSSERKYLWTRAKFYELKSSPDSIKNSLAFVYLFFERDFWDFLDDVNSIWIDEWRGMATPNPSKNLFKSFHYFKPSSTGDLWLLDNSWQLHVLYFYQNFFRELICSMMFRSEHNKW